MKKYYDFTDTSYPAVSLAILERLRLFICTLLYPDETYVNSQKRFVLTDMSPNMTLRQSIKILNLSNATFPFTAYSIEEPEEDPNRQNTFAKTKTYYSSTYGGKLHTYALTQTFPMISFFSTAADYDRARTILLETYSTISKLTVPISINSVTDSFTIIVDFEIGKGNYANEFEQQLVQGNIWDLVHNLKVSYHQLVFDGDVSPVSDIIFELQNLESPLSPTAYTLVSGSFSPNTPTISSTIPTDEAEDISVSTDITINFSTAMNEDSVENNFYIFPYINADFNWNSTSTQLIVDILTPLVSGTTYEWTIYEEAESGEEIPFPSDQEFSFTTE